MKRLLSFTVVLLFLVGCANGNIKASEYEVVNNLDGVTMTVKEGSASPIGLTLVLVNNSDQNYIYGEHYLLEQKVNGDWYQVPITRDNYGFTDIGYLLDASMRAEWNVDWEWLYGSLEAGEYRIIKDILDVEEPGVYDTYHLAATFMIES